jgi:hypothetical protein
MKSNAQHKADERERDKAKGIKRVEVKAHIDDVADVKEYAADKLRERENGEVNAEMS